MISTGHSAEIAGAISVAVAALASIPSCLSLYRRYGPRTNLYQPVGGTYEDEDGKATEESEKQFNQRTPITAAFCFSVLGLLAGLAVPIWVTANRDSFSPSILTKDLYIALWLNASSTILLLFQACVQFVERDVKHRYDLGRLSSLTSVLVAITTVKESSELSKDAQWDGKLTALFAIRITAFVSTSIVFLLIPRRPQVFDENDGMRPVDRENITYLLQKVSYQWPGSLISLAKQKRTLEYTDLAQLENRTRSKTLSANFMASHQYSRLWMTVIVQFRWAFFWQTTWSISSNLCEFVPSISLYYLLRALENNSTNDAVIWVTVLGASMLLMGFIEQRLFFTIWSQLGIPLRNMLSTLIFQKAMRRKDVKGKKKKIERSKPKSSDAAGEIVAGIEPEIGSDATLLNKEAENIEIDEEELDQETRQGTINLIGVDSRRIASFLTYFYFYPGTLVKLTTSVVLLTLIIGWQSVIAGFIAFSITIPLNIWASSRYTWLQGELMSVRDKKLAVMTEALQGIRQIKFSALEKQWQARVGVIRKKEIATIWQCFMSDLVIIMCYITSPILLSAACLTTHALVKGELMPSVAFTTLAILTSLETSLTILPELTTDAIDAWISLARIEAYLNSPEKVDCRTWNKTIVFDHVDIAWPAEAENVDDEDKDRFILRNVNMSVPSKELTVISGKTGSGKSLLLAAILGEVDKLAGTIYVPQPPPLEERFDHKANKSDWIIDSAVAFVSQIPWIENATVRENILFGLPFDSGRYQKTLAACELVKDLEMLDDGDSTEIGHNGVNLSGGQRWRVSFARALYSRAGILVLDDVFSAVDAHVGRHLYESALTGELAIGRTRILVTHHISLVLPQTKYSIHLANGTMAHAGFVEDLRESGALQTAIKETRNGDTDTSSNSEQEDDATEETRLKLVKSASRRSQRSAIVDEGGVDTKGKNQPKKYVEDEKKEKGAIRMDVYGTYLKASGGWKMWVPCVLFFAFSATSEIGRNWWVAQWTHSYKTESLETNSTFSKRPILVQSPLRQLSSSTIFAEKDVHSNNTIYYLSIYLALNFAIVVFTFFKLIVGFITSRRASRILFDKLLYTVLRTPLRWLDTVPVGRILNRFTGDFDVIDTEMRGHISYFFYKCAEVISITVISFAVAPMLIPFGVLLMAFSAWTSFQYLHASRPVKRLENNARSPIYELFGTVLIGMTTVRSFSKSNEYIERMWRRLDQHGRSTWHLWLLNRWMGFRLFTTATLFIILVAAFLVFAKFDASLAGFVLSFALNFSEAITWILRSYASLELDMTACERVQEYTNLETESPDGKEPPATWPTEGRLEVRDLVCGYAADLPAVLKGLSFAVEKGQRVGVVGRTGAGKSSLTLALFRFLEPRSGKVFIDGIDTSTITLHSLRSRLAIIPQDPVLFSGTVRSNLDPFNNHQDPELRESLERVHLTTGFGGATDQAAAAAATADTNRNVFSSLSSSIAEGGLNLSQGQRQLLCLARAIVARPKLMILDEATSAVDKETDELIQRSIREEFEGSTLLVIAHRLSTIADFDKILVMGDGRVVEFDTPRNLLDVEGGAFRSMVQESGERDVLESIIYGRSGTDS